MTMSERSCRWAVLLAGAAIGCTDGSATPLSVQEALRTDAGSAGRVAPNAGRGGGSDPGPGPKAGAPAASCPAAPEEQELLSALNTAITRGDYCFEAPLNDDESLRCVAQFRAFAADGRMSGHRGPQVPDTMGWAPDGRLEGWWWYRWDTDSVEEAKSALLSDRTRKELCEQVERYSYSHVGVGHYGTAWVIGIADPN